MQEAAGTINRAIARRLHARWLSAFCFFFALWAAVGVAKGACADLFELRTHDEVYFKDGTTARGNLYETDNKEEFKIKNYVNNTVRQFNIADTSKILRKATPDSELARLAAQYSGKRPDAILCVAQEAMRKYDQLAPKVIMMLEKESASNNPDILAFLCELYLQKDQAAQALKTAESVVSMSPKARSYMLRGRCFVALGKLEAAEKDLEKAFSLAPEDQEVLVARADYLMQAGRPQDARQMFTNALDKNGRNVGALIGLGMARLRQGEFKEAQQKFLDAMQIEHENKQARLGLASVKLLTKEYEDCYQEAEHVLQLDNHCAQAYGLEGMARMFGGTAESFAVFENRIEESFKEKAGQPRLLLAYAVGLEREAQLLDLTPKEPAKAPDPDAKPVPDLGLKPVDDAKSKRDLAAKKLAEVMESDAPDAYIQYFIGERKFRKGDYAGADAAFQRTVKLAPTFAPACAAVGATALKLGKWEPAREAYEKAIKLDAAFGEYHSGRGLALLKVQRLDEAAEEFRQARELDPRNVTALCGLGWIANKHKNKTSTVEFFQQALTADGSCAYAADGLKKVYAQDAMSVEYLSFDDTPTPPGWKLYGPGSVKPVIENGHLIFKGTQGSASGSRVEVYKDVKGDEFVKLEADLQVDPASPVTFGMRVASTAGSATNFELELGKDEGKELKVRFKDYAGQAPEWRALSKQGKEWPADGHVRLGIETDDLKTGKIRLCINGKVAELTLVLQKPGKINVGFFIQAPPKEVISATVDNVILVTRGVQIDKEAPDTLILLKDDEKKPEPPAPVVPPPGTEKPKEPALKDPVKDGGNK